MSDEISYKHIDGTTYLKAMDVVKWIRAEGEKRNYQVELYGQLINDILELQIKCLEENRK